MELTLNVPAFIFPTVSLLMLAYTNRFLALAALIRSLHERYQREPSPGILAQMQNLRLRVRLIRDMQAVGVLSLFLSVASMFFILGGRIMLATWLFGGSLVLLMVSLALSMAEIYTSIRALNIQLGDMTGKETGDIRQQT
ncbi:MAG TPA: DUF2721 domain-containing protein [Cytophagales bacterium]|jgi:hypothetical protein